MASSSDAATGARKRGFAGKGLLKPVRAPRPARGQRHRVTYAQSDATRRAERRAMRRKVVACLVILVVLGFFSLCFTGAQGQYYPWAGHYAVYTPDQVAYALFLRVKNLFAEVTHLYPVLAVSQLAEVPGYFAVFYKLQVVGITLLCAVLLSVSGMLYQNVFKNPLAGPGMLGVSSGVSLGVMVLVALNGAAAVSLVNERYLYCYAFGALILLFVIAAGKRLSGKGKPFDIVTMILVGSILSQLLGSVVSYVTLFVMDEDDYLAFCTISQMLTVDTSLISWITLAVACVVSFVPIYLLRFKMNALAYTDQEVRLFGLNPLALKAVALLCGSVMVLTAQVHVGTVGLVTLVVPFLARSIFGCEFRRQLWGNLLIGMILLLACRTLVDMIPFVGDGLSIGSAVSVVALPLFMVIMARQMRGWE